MRLFEVKQPVQLKWADFNHDNFQQLKPYIDDTMLTDVQREPFFPAGQVLSPSSRACDDAALVDGPLLIRLLYESPTIRWWLLCQAPDKPLVSAGAHLSGLPALSNGRQSRAQFGAAFPVVPGGTGGV